MKLLLADDHTLFRDALVQYIERAEPGSEISVAKSLDGAIEILEKKPEKPDLILLDFRMPGMNRLEGLRRVREGWPDIPVALLSGMAETEDVKAAMELGAMGYFPKTLSGQALLKAIQLVMTGERFLPIERDTNEVMPAYYPDGENNTLSPYIRAHAPENGNSEEINLTNREKEVLTFLLSGVSNKEIAREMNLQVVTVKLHVRGICRKLGAKNRTQAALRAIELGLVPANDGR